jgi:hypothetical protein
MKQSLKSFLFLIIAASISLSAQAQKAVLIEDETPTDSGPEQHKTIETKTETRNSSFFDKKSASEIFAGGDYGSVYEMRAKRRLGVGLEAAGELGTIGAQAELNFAMDDSAVIGFGGGPQYSSFNMGWHHNFGGKALTPFTSLSYSRWYNNSSTGNSVNDTMPSYLSQKFLSDSDRATGKFAVNFVIPGAGLQYNILSGPYAGTSIYAEAMMMVSMANLQNVITGAFGAMYFF